MVQSYAWWNLTNLSRIVVVMCVTQWLFFWEYSCTVLWVLVGMLISDYIDNLDIYWLI